MSETKGAEEAEAKVEKMFEYGYRIMVPTSW